ncbi:MAG: hypothetical protein FWG64_02830 [Firmicutes bacterium]|nr:hypothetical protein [Bacillota bacterium]
MTIIKKGIIKPPTIWRFECEKCDCIFECVREEVTWRQTGYNETDCFYLCPICASEVMGK